MYHAKQRLIWFYMYIHDMYILYMICVFYIMYIVYVIVGAIDISQNLPQSWIKHMIPFDSTTLSCPSIIVLGGGSLSARQFVQRQWERVGFRRLESSCKFASGVHTT